ncbi:MAG: malate synthase G, partial [Acidimicrobiales bacterium]
MTSEHVSIGGLEVAAALADFVRRDVAPGTGVDPDAFWAGFEELLRTLQPRALELLAVRDRLQHQIDQWHLERRALPHDADAYETFLHEIGYLVEQPDDVSVATANVDPEIASVAGPQLVVPVDNARYALNAANSRWGSLYDALYGTDVIGDEDGAGRGGAYNPARGAKVIGFGRSLLDAHVPLEQGSHASATSYRVSDGALVVQQGDAESSLVSPGQFVGYTGAADDPSTVLLTK